MRAHPLSGGAGITVRRYAPPPPLPQRGAGGGAACGQHPQCFGTSAPEGSSSPPFSPAAFERSSPGATTTGSSSWEAGQIEELRTIIEAKNFIIRDLGQKLEQLQGHARGGCISGHNSVPLPAAPRLFGQAGGGHEDPYTGSCQPHAFPVSTCTRLSKEPPAAAATARVESKWQLEDTMDLRGCTLTAEVMRLHTECGGLKEELAAATARQNVLVPTAPGPQRTSFLWDEVHLEAVGSRQLRNSLEKQAELRRECAKIYMMEGTQLQNELTAQEVTAESDSNKLRVEFHEEKCKASLMQSTLEHESAHLRTTELEAGQRELQAQAELQALRAKLREETAAGARELGAMELELRGSTEEATRLRGELHEALEEAAADSSDRRFAGPSKREHQLPSTSMFQELPCQGQGFAGHGGGRCASGEITSELRLQQAKCQSEYAQLTEDLCNAVTRAAGSSKLRGSPDVALLLESTRSKSSENTSFGNTAIAAAAACDFALNVVGNGLKNCHIDQAVLRGEHAAHGNQHGQECDPAARIDEGWGSLPQLRENYEHQSNHCELNDSALGIAPLFGRFADTSCSNGSLGSGAASANHVSDGEHLNSTIGLFTEQAASSGELAQSDGQACSGISEHMPRSQERPIFFFSISR